MTPVDVLHDDVLLVIFDFYVGISLGEDAWQSLVHVCRRWRCLVFESPRRLNLRLVCTPRTPVRQSLDIWPALPLIVRSFLSSTVGDNTVAALEHSDRVCEIYLYFREETERLEWDKVLAAMQVPFPALTNLLFQCEDEEAPVIPDTFLGGSAPLLRSFDSYAIPLPGIPMAKLLRSTNHLVDLRLSGIPDSGYISPEVMATCLSVLTSLETLTLKFLPTFSSKFLFSQARRKNRRLPPMTRFILPDLTRFSFRGDTEYVEHLIAQLDAPQLQDLGISFFDEMNLVTPHLVQFISRTSKFQEPNEAHVGYEYFDTSTVVRLGSRGRLVVISCEQSYEELSSIAKICTKCLPPLLTVEDLRLGSFPTTYPYSPLDWDDAVYQWLEFLRPFTAVKSLYLSTEFQRNMASALRELVGNRTMEVLPSLQNIFLARSELYGRSFQDATGGFVAARRLSGHPIAVFPLL